MKEPKFKTKDGSLTGYGFACGYVQSESFCDDDIDRYICQNFHGTWRLFCQFI